jgi:hypothetical protein
MCDSGISKTLSFGLMDPSQPDYAGRAARAEHARQTNIGTGMDQINAIYGGGSAPMYNSAKAFDPSQSYYTMDGKGNYNQATSQWLNNHGQRAFKKGNLFTKEVNNYQGFGDDFYKQREQDYVNYAMPQLADQYQQTKNAMNFGLANRGLTASSAADKEKFDLEKQNLIAKQQIGDTARGQSQALKRSIEDQRNALISQLYQTADPAGARRSAIDSASQFAQPSIYPAMGQAFGSLAQQYYLNSIYRGTPPTSYVTPPQYGNEGNSGALGPVSYGGGL